MAVVAVVMVWGRDDYDSDEGGVDGEESVGVMRVMMSGEGVCQEEMIKLLL